MGRDLRPQVVALIVVASLALLVGGSVLLWSALKSLGAASEVVGTSTVEEIVRSGVFLVGKDIHAGTYRSQDAEAGCSWAVYSRGVAVQTGEGSEPVELTILPHYTSFSTNRCGTWGRTGDR